MSYRRSTLALALAFAASPAAEAADHFWPNVFGIGPCTGTLQACIDGAAPGDTVIITSDDFAFPDAYTLVDEDIVISKSLTLRGAPGIDAVFAPNRTILVSEPSATPLQVAIESLTLRRGEIRFEHRASAAGALFRAERVRVLDVTETFGCGLSFAGPGSGASEVRIFDNFVRVEASAATRRSGICSIARPVTATIARNRVEAAEDAMLRGIGLSGGGSTFRVTGNTVIGDRFNNGIYLAQAASPPRDDFVADDNVVAGQWAPDNQFAGGIAVLAGNAQLRIVNNTVVDGLAGISVSSFTGGTIDGEIANNLVAFNDGASIGYGTPPQVTLTNRNNLVHANGSNAVTLGPGTRTVNPLLASLRDPHPRFDSATFNAGANDALPAFSAFDADGEPRITYGTVDIGAYEQNDDRSGVQLARDDNTFLNFVDVDPFEGLPYGPTAIFAVTPHHVVGAPAADDIPGIWLSNSPPTDWSVYLENPATPMPPGQRYSVMAVGNGRTGYVHDTSLASIVDQYSRLDHPELNARPAAIATVVHAYASGATEAYHDFPIGLDYFGGRWYVRNEDSSAMPSQRRFHVIVAPVFTLNAWRVRNSATSSVAALRLEHPLLDDNACAAPFVTRVDPGAPSVFNPSPYAVEYRPGFGGAPGRWFIAAQGAGASIPADAEYNVMIDGTQVNACRNAALAPLFADSFE